LPLGGAFIAVILGDHHAVTSINKIIDDLLNGHDGDAVRVEVAPAATCGGARARMSATRPLRA
jgi:hypothetical protein